jgi:hypothetical protein
MKVGIKQKMFLATTIWLAYFYVSGLIHPSDVESISNPYFYEVFSIVIKFIYGVTVLMTILVIIEMIYLFIKNRKTTNEHKN